MSLARLIAAALPQTQCTRCGEPDCARYAEAITQGAPINRCPPGGDEGIRRLAALTGQAVVALDTAHGREGPRHLAWIDEAQCIGCTLCITACPVDAIIGAPKRMHTVMEPWCTGCELCVPVCPVDCIHLDPVAPALSGWAAWSQAQAGEALGRYQQHLARLAREAAQEDARLAARALPQASASQDPDPALPPPGPTAALPVEQDNSRQTAIAAALARSRMRRGI
jgi:Na+-translocating ferredoxin:NAD+ oxidoreductase subunit B